MLELCLNFWPFKKSCQTTCWIRRSWSFGKYPWGNKLNHFENRWFDNFFQELKLKVWKRSSMEIHASFDLFFMPKSYTFRNFDGSHDHSPWWYLVYDPRKKYPLFFFGTLSQTKCKVTLDICFWYSFLLLFCMVVLDLLSSVHASFFQPLSYWSTLFNDQSESLK